MRRFRFDSGMLQLCDIWTKIHVKERPKKLDLEQLFVISIWYNQLFEGNYELNQGLEEDQLSLLSQWTASGKALSVGVDKYQLTSDILSSYRVCLVLEQPQPTFSAGLDDPDLAKDALDLDTHATKLELYLLLQRDGWRKIDGESKTAKQIRDLKPYHHGEPKAGWVMTYISLEWNLLICYVKEKQKVLSQGEDSVLIINNTNWKFDIDIIMIIII